MHLYLLAAPSAAAVIDLLTAAKYWRQTQRILDNKQLFLAGYSEGAYVSMATQKALQAGTSVHRSDVVSVVAGAAPYNVGRTMDEALKLVISANPVLGELLNPGVLKLLSDVDRRNVRDRLLVQLLGGTSEANFSPTFIDYYLTDNRTALETFSNADDWHPANDAVKRRCKPRHLNQLHGGARRPQRVRATLLAVHAGFVEQACEGSLKSDARFVFWPSLAAKRAITVQSQK